MIDKSKSSVVIVKSVITLRSELSSIGLVYLSKMAAKYDCPNQTNQRVKCIESSFL